MFNGLILKGFQKWPDYNLCHFLLWAKLEGLAVRVGQDDKTAVCRCGFCCTTARRPAPGNTAIILSPHARLSRITPRLRRAMRPRRHFRASIQNITLSSHLSSPFNRRGLRHSHLQRSVLLFDLAICFGSRHDAILTKIFQELRQARSIVRFAWSQSEVDSMRLCAWWLNSAESRAARARASQR